jgi:PPOX class probable F420-dependent enzyme
MVAQPPLSPNQRALLDEARRATLATIAPDGVPRLVPVCYAVHPGDAVLYVAIDDKPKRAADPRRLARVRDIEADPRVTILVDRWDEDWSRLAWLRCTGTATILEPDDADDRERTAAVVALRERYPVYEAHDLERSLVLRIAIERTAAWGDL